MTYSSLFGQFTSRDQVEAAVLSTLRTWIITYIAEIERQQGLVARTIPVPPVPQSFRGGVDFDTWMQEWSPVVNVVAQPFEDATRFNPGDGYGQWFEIRAAATVAADQRFMAQVFVDEEEDSARKLADLYGMAITGVLVQQGGLGPVAAPFAERTRLVTAPRTELVNPAVRRVARSMVIVHSFVAHLVDDSQGPRVPPADPYALPGNWTTATEVDVQVQTTSPTGAQAPATGVQIVKPVPPGGQIIVKE